MKPACDKVLNKLRELQKEYLVDLEDAVVVVRDGKGKVRIKQASPVVRLGGAGAQGAAPQGGVGGPAAAPADRGGAAGRRPAEIAMPNTVVGLIDDGDRAQDAIKDLLEAGFDRRNVGLIAPDVRSESETVLSTTRTGLAAGAAAAMLLGTAATLIPGIGLATVAGPLLAVPALATLVGGLVGALTASGVSESDANFYAEGVRRGGVLVTVRAESPEQAARAARILKENGAADVEQRAAEWQRQGWDGRFHAP